MQVDIEVTATYTDYNECDKALPVKMEKYMQMGVYIIGGLVVPWLAFLALPTAG